MSSDTLDARALAIIDTFRREWESSRPDVAGHWQSHPERPLALLTAIAAIDLQCRLTRGEQVTVEDYTGRFPELGDPALVSRLEAVVTDFPAASRDPFATKHPPASGNGNLEPMGSLRPLDDSSLADTLVGTELGGISIVRLIAEGGMGRVYEGRQQKPRRPVAVKVMKPGITSANMLKRFEYEAQVLARLRHPGIAQIHTVGIHEVRGHTVPYFVMEYIPNAKPLTQYAENRKLSTHERLDLFRKVCDAVAHGHQKGIIHRDLKPGNVLVDSSGQPKVIDFGVARSTDSDMALTTMQTDVGALIGTLQYMSPEQFDADPHDLDVRLDVYALGVILYELLTGKPPYDVKRRAIFEIARVVREEEPTPISSLNKTLRRDVAIIAGKCLQKDRNRRYSSATELAGDVGRYLAGEPITAAPPSFFDAVARVARRHKAAAAAFAGITATIVTAAVGISAFAIRAERAREEAERQEAVAIEERDVAAQARVAADAEATKAKRRLYAATVYKVQTALEGPRRSFAKYFYRDAQTAYRDAYGENAPRPLELSLLAPELDGAIASFHVHGNIEFVSPDGSRMATISDGTAHLWDAITAQPLAILKCPEATIVRLAFSPDGSCLATGADNGTVRLWNAATGESQCVVVGHESFISSLGFSPNGRILATGCWDNATRVWDVASGELVKELTGESRGIQFLVFSPDGSALATMSRAGTVQLWDTMSWKSQAVLREHERRISSLAFSPDGLRVLTSSQDASGTGQAVRLWDATTGKSVEVLKGGEAQVESLTFSSEGSRLAALVGSYTVRVWDAVTGKSLVVFNADKHSSPGFEQLVFSPDGSRLAVGEGFLVRVWDSITAEPRAVLRGHVGRISSLAFSPDGHRLATGSWDHSARIWDVATGEPQAVLKGHEGVVTSLAFSRDGCRLTTRSTDGTARIWEPFTVTASIPSSPQRGGALSPDGWRLATVSGTATTIWDLLTCEVIALLKGHKNNVLCLSFSPDGSWVATGSMDHTARLWDATTGQPLDVLRGHEDMIVSVAFSPDGSRLATASRDKTVRLWDMKSRESLAVISGHSGIVVECAFSPDSARLATRTGHHWIAGSAVDDAPVRLWNAATGEPLAALEERHRWGALLAFSPDGSRLATGARDGTVRLWNAATGKSERVLEGDKHRITSLGFSRDGRMLAAGAQDNSVRIWDVASGESLKDLKSEGEGIQSLAFSSDGSRLTMAFDNMMTIWDAISGESLAVLKTNGVKRHIGIEWIGFCCEGTQIVTGAFNTVHVWGLSNAEIYRNRLTAKAIRDRLRPVVDQWFTGDLAAVKRSLAAAKATMTPADWREAANMVLRRAAGE